MNIKPIRSDADLREVFKRLDALSQAKKGSVEADEVEVLKILIEAYAIDSHESERSPIISTDSIAAFKLRMERERLTPEDIEAFVRSTVRASIVSKRKPVKIGALRITLLASFLLACSWTFYRILS